MAGRTLQPKGAASPPPTDPGRLAKPLLWSVAIAVALYGLLVAAVDGPAFLAAISTLEPRLVAIILLLSLLNYGLRCWRWQGLLNRLGHRLPLGLGLRYYLAGFALTTTPGKAGEAVRSLFLKRHQVGYVDSLAVFFSERLVDVVAMLLLALAALYAFPATRWSGWAIVGLLLVLLLIIHRSDWQAGLRAGGQTLFGGRWQAPVSRACDLLEQAAVLLTPGSLLSATAVGLMAWGAEGVGFYLVATALGFEGHWLMVVGIYAIASLIGALSMLPGGLGGAEAAMTSLLILGGGEPSVAVATTVICRMATLWFAVAIGVLAMAGCRTGQQTASPTIHPQSGGKS